MDHHAFYDGALGLAVKQKPGLVQWPNIRSDVLDYLQHVPDPVGDLPDTGIHTGAAS
jgi:hypothetical protein